MSKPRIKVRAKTPDAAELATWPMERVEAEYEKHLSAWMARRDGGQPNKMRHFLAMEPLYQELMRRRYGGEAVSLAKEELGNFRSMGLVPKG